MKITQITFTSRMGLPSYSHEEIVAVAMISEGVDAKTQMAELKATVNQVLYGTAPAPKATQTSVVNTEKVSEKKVDLPPKTDTTAVPKANAAKSEEPKKETIKTDEATGVTTAQLGDEPAATINLKKDKKAAAPKEDKNIEKYDRAIKEHTSTFAGHLTKTYGDTWKTKEGLKAFSESLNGAEFRDAKSGNLVPSFIAKIEEFFGSENNVL